MLLMSSGSVMAVPHFCFETLKVCCQVPEKQSFCFVDFSLLFFFLFTVYFQFCSPLLFFLLLALGLFCCAALFVCFVLGVVVAVLQSWRENFYYWFKIFPLFLKRFIHFFSFMCACLCSCV